MKKLLTLLMALTMTAGCLAACGDGQKASETVPETTAIQQESDASQEDINKADAQAMRDYLGQYIDLSLYSEGEDIGSYYYTLILTPQSKIEHKLDALYPEVELPDFKNLKYGSQFKEVEDAGFAAVSDNIDVEAQVSVPASLTVSESPYLAIDLMVYNPLTTTNTKSECIIDTYQIPVADGLVFNYNGITNESTLEDIIETLGAPDPEIQITASEYEFTTDQDDKLRFRLFYDNRDEDHTQTEIDLVYDKEAGTAAFSELSVYENDR